MVVARRRRAQRACSRTCGLGRVRTSKILMQPFSSSLEQTALLLKEKLHSQHSTEGKWKAASLCVTQVLQFEHWTNKTSCRDELWKLHGSSMEAFSSIFEGQLKSFLLSTCTPALFLRHVHSSNERCRLDTMSPPHDGGK